ncbi:hypothetical protein K2173_006613 [Erythroxylum novogranatense]|uniref:Disease resistance R13L4/SHOC-2-like LRR domain-containing protein n=1 Tax=Erythroxylum novogranatense TaxID=1862640 RepID=A0AAV8T5E2_9ROSI|nr:hypothetical protein K2173_006613 [Erythroxylum novogranatense]
MATSMYIYFVGLLVLGGEVTALSRNSDGSDMNMEMNELLGLFEVLEELLDDPDFAQAHPQPCTNTPWPGIQCEIGEEDPPIFHVTKIHIGPDISSPPCKSSASLSKSLQKLPYLKSLSIFSCFVTSRVVLSANLFGAFSSIEHLVLDSNPALSGEIPSNFTNVSRIKVLSLSQNNLQGNIPSGIGRLVGLEQLDLSYNNLRGEIPETIGNLKSLTILDLSQNGLQGNVPGSLGQLQILQKIDLGSNKLLGAIPSELGDLKRLVLFDLSYNFLNGPLPVTLSGLEQLQYLIVDDNPLNTEIPLFLKTLKNLKSISLSGCGLKGCIPSLFSSLKTLTALSLDNNNLTGTVPSSLGSLPNLDHLNLSHNLLSGELLLPDDFVQRLGKRLVVKGNSGLCTSNKTHKMDNFSEYSDLEIPTCLNTEGEQGTSCVEGKGTKSLCPEKNPDESKGMGIHQQWYHNNIVNSIVPPFIFQYAFFIYLCLFLPAFLFGTL